MAERDTRFGGNMARANEGAQYVGSPRDNNVAAPTWQPGRNWEDSKTTDWKYRGRDPEGNIQATWRTNRSGPEGTGGISWDDFYRDNNFGRDYWDEHGYLTGSPRQRTEFKSGPMSSEFFNEMYPTYDDQIMRGQRGRDYQNRLGTEWPSQGEITGWESKLPVPYEAHRGTGYGDKEVWSEEGEFGGIGSTDEYLKAELSTPQLDWMEGPYGNPGGGGYTDSPAGWEAYKSNVNKYEDKGGILPWWLGGRSPQETATDQEIMDQLKRNIRNKKWGRDTPSQVSPNWRVTT
jgi:hypothetical protein